MYMEVNWLCGEPNYLSGADNWLSPVDNDLSRRHNWLYPALFQLSARDKWLSIFINRLCRVGNPLRRQDNW